MGAACGRAGVLGSALIHTKTGAHREDVAQHAGDRFGSPITRRPDAAALSDGADSPPVSIPALRMPPRKPQMTGRTGRAWLIVSICNIYRAKLGLTVTDRDIQSASLANISICNICRPNLCLRVTDRDKRSTRLTNVSICNSYRVNRPVTVTDRDKPIRLKTTSQSVTVTEQNRPQMLQIETVELLAEEQSRSVTTRLRIPCQMLQIETNVPSTRPDRQQKGPDAQSLQLERPTPSNTTREAEPTPRSPYSASGSLKFLESKTMQV